MKLISDAYINALLSDATYVHGLNPNSNLETALAVRMTTTLAKYIADNFSVVTQIQSGDFIGLDSGFDATVWRQTATGKLFVSMRGTEPGADLAIADLDLAVNGNARDQLVDMVNWWLRETGSAGQSVRQIKLGKRGLLSSPTFVEAAAATGSGRITAADLIAGIEVDGHSLGGYLATAFTRLFGSQAHVQYVSTFNSAGFAPGSESVFRGLESLIGLGYGFGRFPSGSEQSNYFARHGINLTTNSLWFSQQGQRVELFNEEDISQVGNHFMYKLSDSLTLAAALEKLDPSMTMGRVNMLFEAGSNRTAASLEGTLDGLRRLFGGAAIAATPEGDASSSAPSRVAFQENVKALMDSTASKSLAGKANIILSGVGLASTARNDFASLVSLLTLSPVVLKATSGNEAAVESALAAAWSRAFAAWQSDKGLSRTDRDAGMETFSQNYLDDRASMLSWLVYRNTKDNIAVSISDANARDQVFRDFGATATTEVRTGGLLSSDSDRRHFLFGGDGANALIGGTASDHLYGGAGADTLNGLGGNDYLEGNADGDRLYGGDGNDTLLGGAGIDTLYGDAGNDTLRGGADADTLEGGGDDDQLFGNGGDDGLNGGKGNDRLEGGAEFDTYTFETAWGSDTIFDSDTSGKIMVTGFGVVDGALAKVVAPNVWQTNDKRFKYELIAASAKRNDLYISFGGIADVIKIEGWTPSALGISLGSDPALPTQTTSTFVGTTDPNGEDRLAAHSTNPSLLLDLEGNDLLLGRDGDDRIEGGLGDDLISGGGGVDTIFGGAGDDWIYGSGYGNINGFSAVPADASIIAQAYSWVIYNKDNVIITDGVDMTPLYGDGGNYIDGGLGNDVIHAGTANDTVHGGDGRDWLQGLAGNDALFGDAGDDVVWGDGNVGSPCLESVDLRFMDAA